MIAAIYARKSTDQAGAGDKSESVERQLARARAYATGKGWKVVDVHIYVDDGISGAEFGDRRPGLARLLNALRPRPPFQVLVMSEESRLGRETDRDGLRPEAARPGWRPGMALSRGSPAYARLPYRQAPDERDRVRRRARAGARAPADL